jgi:hypothetical protein
VTGGLGAARRSEELREFVARLLGWARARTVELALRSVELALDHRAALVVSGLGDMVPIALALHRRTLGADRPFVVCDPRRADAPASVRSPANREGGLAAFDAARGGTLCVRTRRLPQDFPALVARLRGSDDVLYTVCAERLVDAHEPWVRPAPLAVPALIERSAEIDRIIAEYASDAIVELGAPRSSFTSHDHAWVREHAATSLVEIEKATLRLTAIRASYSASAAAARLGMSLVSLSRWIDRRRRGFHTGAALSR